MHSDPQKIREEAEETVHDAKLHVADPIGTQTGSMQEAEAEQMQSEAAKAKQALNDDVGRTPLNNTNTANQFRQ